VTTDPTTAERPAAAATRIHRYRWMDRLGRHRALLVILLLIVFPWVAPYEALAANILVFGLFAVGFNLIFGERLEDGYRLAPEITVLLNNT
jgi:branched-chain amino acid transport system permease protein